MYIPGVAVGGGSVLGAPTKKKLLYHSVELQRHFLLSGNFSSISCASRDLSYEVYFFVKNCIEEEN